MELRPYQVGVLNKINLEFKTKKEVVLASAPNSGKTFIAINFMKQNVTDTFLILSHGTLVLKDQWKDVLEKSGLQCSNKLGESRITYGLPQSFRKHEGKAIDYLIIDEAHEFTFAQMVKEIKEKFKFKKIIYLTGTPSKFIAKGYEPIIVPAIDLIKDGYSSDLYLGMVSTKANIIDDSYNTDGDVQAKDQYKLENSVNSDLDQLLESMNTRLRETGLFKDKPKLRSKLEWAPTLGKLHKTMIACRSIKQADNVKKYFDNQKIKCILSHSINDPDSLNIPLFKSDESIKVLIVVDRGILGFDMADLVNVVDLTCSRNIDRTYQLYARVMRKSQQHDKKYFFKLSTEEHMLINKFYMNAALGLMFTDFISKYNGKNLNGCKIPVIITKKNKKRTETTGSVKPTQDPVVAIDEFFKGTVEAGALLIDIENKIGKSANEYAYVTFAKIREQLSDGRFVRKIVKITEENLLYMIKHGEVDERIYD